MAAHDKQHALDSMNDHSFVGFVNGQLLVMTGGVPASSLTVSEADAADAVSKRHTQDTDQYLDFGGANQASALDVADAVAKKHTQDTDQYLDFGGVNQVAASALKALLTGLDIATPAPALNNALIYNGTKFAPSAISAAIVTVAAVTGLSATAVQAALTELLRSYKPSTTSAGTYNMAVTERYVRTSGAGATIYLPATLVGADAGLPFTVKRLNAGGGPTVVDGNGFNIDGVTTYSLLSQHDAVTIVWNGSSWDVV